MHELVGVQIAQLSLVHHRCADVRVARIPDTQLGRLTGRQIDASLLDQLDVAADEFGLAEVEYQPPMCASRVERKGGERGLLTHGGRVTAERCGRRRALQGDREWSDGAANRKVGGLVRSVGAARMGHTFGRSSESMIDQLMHGQQSSSLLGQLEDIRRARTARPRRRS